jgi:Zn-dependent M28 family amino/carboxypeptidase
MRRIGLLTLLVVSSRLLAQPIQVQLKAEYKPVLDRISAQSMRGHLSFIASDLLKGRATPSPELDIAAEYIAAQFRRAGLQGPIGVPAEYKPSDVRPSNLPYLQQAIWRSGDQERKAYNVIGVLPGSDPELKDTYIIISAHYDHLGVRSSGEGDLIFNGANDDGSGTVSVIELASALSAAKPKRSIVFLCFYGEERGLLGSRYYGQNPVFPLAKTVAMVNLEHVGRTDDLEGERKGEASMTGFDYSDLGPIFEAAGKLVDVKVTKHPRNSDSFFGRSDNQALADQGVPAHTLCTSFIFPDYHQVGDHWEKVDYDNMARVNRAIALGVLNLADSPREPRWNAENSRAKRYLDAWNKLKGGRP